MLRRLLKLDNIARMALVISRHRWMRAHAELMDILVGVEEGMRRDQRMEGLL